MLFSTDAHHGFNLRKIAVAVALLSAPRRVGGIETTDARIIASPSSVEAHTNSVHDGENYKERQSTVLQPSPSSDIFIDCQTDTIFIELAENMQGVVRHCTIYTFGPIHEPIALTCDVPRPSLPGVICETDPAFLIVGDEQASANGVTVTIHATSGRLKGNEEGKISIEATHGFDAQTAEIIVIIVGDEPANLFGSNLNVHEPINLHESDMNVQADDQARDYFSFAGQSNSVGHTTSFQSISKNGTYWLNLLSLFNESEYIGISQTWNQSLYDTIQAVHTDSNGPASVITLLRDEAVKLQALGLLNGLNRSLSFGW
jgi:hypothetical protein